MSIRHAARRLACSPGFTAVAVLSLAMGIGANTAIFSLVNAVLLRERPYERPEELFEVYIEDEEIPYQVFSYPDFEDLRDATRDVFAGVVASQIGLAQADGEDGIEMLFAELVSGNYFSLLGVQPRLGRGFLPEEDQPPAGQPVVVLGHGYWQRAFAGSEDVLGREIRLSGQPYRIVGVAPREYGGNLRGLVPDLFVPIQRLNQLQPSTTDQLAQRGNHSVFVKARIEESVTREQAEVALAAVATTQRETHPDRWTGEEGMRLIPTSSVILYPPLDRFVRAAAGLLVVVVGLVLVMACINLASFLLARGSDRSRELALRQALGATRRTLIAGLLGEATLLALLGGVAGIGLAMLLLRLLVAADLPLPVPIRLDLDLDLTVLLYSLLVSLAAALLFGLAPALQSTRNAPAAELQGARGGSATAGRLRAALIVTQVAVALVLTIGAGLFLRSFLAIRSVDPGFGREPAAIASLGVPGHYDEAQGRAFYRRLLERIEQQPGVTAVGLIGNLHLNTLSTNTARVTVDGVEPPPGRDHHSVDIAAADAGFFVAAGIPLLEGRTFHPTDDDDAPPVAIVSRAMAERFWPGTSAVGKSFREAGGERVEIVGIAADTKVRTLGEAPRPFVYVPYEQNYEALRTVVASTSADAQSLALELLSIGRQLEPELWVWEAKTMERHLGIVTLPSRMSALLLTVFAALALVLSSIGLYGVVSYAVARRTREVGIRIALGAGSHAVVRMLMGSGLRLVLVGAAIGLPLALLLARTLSRLLFGIATVDLLAFAGAPLLMLAVGLLAAFLPARRASHIEPVQALRTE